jgi:hypothetical protein
VIFSVKGPYEVPRRHNGLVDTTIKAKREFWEEVEADAAQLSEACGIYIFSVKARRGGLPWYVGRTTRRDFRHECLGPHQVNLYNQPMADRRGRPELFLIAKKTPSGRYASPSINTHHDIEFLEDFMIGMALKRNPDLLNARSTAMLKNLVVPGVINTPRRPPTLGERNLREALAL